MSLQQGADTLLPNPATGGCSRSTVQWTAGAGAGTPCETDSRPNDATSLSSDFPIATDLHLLGPMSARLWVGSVGGRDALVTARAEDVAPDGTTTQMSAGWDVISLRALDPQKTVYANRLMTQPYHPFTQASVLPVPSDGSPVEVDVEIYPTGWTLPAGHKLRLTLQSADEPHLTASLPTGLNSAGATLSIYHDASHDSELVIPVRGAGAGAPSAALTVSQIKSGAKPKPKKPKHHKKKHRPACRIVHHGHKKHRVCPRKHKPITKRHPH